MSSLPAQVASSKSAQAHMPGRGRVYDSIADAIGDTPLVRLNKLPQQHGVKATILAKLEYFNPAGSVKDRIGAAMIAAMEKAGLINRPSQAASTGGLVRIGAVLKWNNRTSRDLT